jgi:hypothetical protein
MAPRQWDLVGLAVHRELGWLAEPDYQRFCDQYGADVRKEPAYARLRAAQELRMVCWMAQRAAGGTAVAAEFAMRVRDLGKPETPKKWCPR